MYNIYLFAVIITKIVRVVVVVNGKPSGNYFNNCYFYNTMKKSSPYGIACYIEIGAEYGSHQKRVAMGNNWILLQNRVASFQRPV